VIPKPVAGKIPMLITGGSRQSPDWVASNGDGWITYPRGAAMQGQLVQEFRKQSQDAGQAVKPVSQSLYIDLLADPDAPPRPIHLGFASGAHFLISYLLELKQMGINHVAINLRFNSADIEDTMKRLADDVLPALKA